MRDGGIYRLEGQRAAVQARGWGTCCFLGPGPRPTPSDSVRRVAQTRRPLLAPLGSPRRRLSLGKVVVRPLQAAWAELLFAACQKAPNNKPRAAAASFEQVGGQKTLQLRERACLAAPLSGFSHCDKSQAKTSRRPPSPSGRRKVLGGPSRDRPAWLGPLLLCFEVSPGRVW